MNTIIRRVGFNEIAIAVFTIVVIFCPQAANHQLERPGEMIHGESCAHPASSAASSATEMNLFMLLVQEKNVSKVALNAAHQANIQWGIDKNREVHESFRRAVPADG